MQEIVWHCQVVVYVIMGVVVVYVIMGVVVVSESSP